MVNRPKERHKGLEHIELLHVSGAVSHQKYKKNIFSGSNKLILATLIVVFIAILVVMFFIYR